LWPGLQYPRAPGHEIAGIIDELGAGVEGWKKGQRVGMGWDGGHCGQRAACGHGDFVLCSNLQVPGISYDGGYAEYSVAPAAALATAPSAKAMTPLIDGLGADGRLMVLGASKEPIEVSPIQLISGGKGI
jgi:D-arabinose 1-dehydrogenase-like Zn-dependent alcohol dehydrogenase